LRSNPVKEIKVVLGDMSEILVDSLSDLIDAQDDMRVVARARAPDKALEVVRLNHADVLIVQGAEAPEPLASVIEVEPLGLLVIDRDGHAGALTRMSAASCRLDRLSSEELLSAVRFVSTGDES
jgi:chemotaxis response regulator CheB